MDAVTKTPPPRLSIVFAGEIFDGHDAGHPLIRDNAGRAFFVRVRAMPARHLGRILQICLDEAALLEFVCQAAPVPDPGAEPAALIPPPWEPVSPDWIDGLDDASHLLLVDAAQRLNFTRAAHWGERQIAARNFQAPLLLKVDESMSPVVAKMVGLILSSLKSSGSLPEPSTTSSTPSRSTSSS